MAPITMAVLAMTGCCLLAGCEGMVRSINAALSPHPASPPIATASDNGSARLMLILCDSNRRNTESIGLLIDNLVMKAPLVTAQGAANASVTINLCGGSGPALDVPAPPLRR